MVPPDNEIELDELASEPDEGTVKCVERIDGDIAVAGAGGKMGFHLCLMLRRAIERSGNGKRVYAISRFEDKEKRKPFEDSGIDTIPTDLSTERGYENLPEVAAAFYLAGMKFGTSSSPELLKVFNEDMPARFALHYSDVPIVALSTGCVYPFVSPSSEGSKETEPVGPTGEYAVSCVGREKAFESVSLEKGTPIALIRLNYSVDLRYGVLVDIAQNVFSGEPVDVSMGYLNCIWQGDATRHIVRALSDAAASPNSFILNVTGERILKVREIAEWFGERFGKPVTVIGEEAPTAWLSDAGKAHALYGKPKVDEASLMEWVAYWTERGNPILGKPTHFEVRDGKY